MLAAILYILKIIGIVLLCILGFILAVILLVLFYPWGYCIDIKKEEQLTGRIRISWLFYILMAEVLYQDGVNIRCRIFGIVIYDKLKRERRAAEREARRAAKKHNAKKEPTLTAAEVISSDMSKENSGEKNDNDAEKNEFNGINVENAGLTDRINSDQKKSKDSGKPDQPKNKNRKSWWEFPQFFFDLIIEWIEKTVDFLFKLPEIINNWAEHLEEKLEHLADQYDYYTKLFQKKGSKWVISFLKNELFLLLKHIRPRSSKIDLYYANDDPANVANMMAYYGMAMPFLPKHTTFTAELGESRLTGSVRTKGRIFLIVILCHGLKIFFNKKVRIFLKLLKREEE